MQFQATRTSTSFWQGPTRLAADLVVPAGPPPFPAVVLVGDAGGPRDDGPWVDELAHGGLLTLSWDSPGWRESPGQRRWQSPDQRIPELLAAIDYLATVPGLPSGGVGLVAAGLGGWAAMMAASVASRVEAIVLLSTPLTNVLAQEVELVGLNLRATGFTAAEVQLAQTVMWERIRRLCAGQGGRVVLEAEAACRQAPWYSFLPGTTPAELEALIEIGRYDAAALLSLVRCPVLAIFHERDDQTNVWQDAQLARRSLDARGRRDHLVLIVPQPGSWRGISWEVTRSGVRMLPEGSPDLIGLIAGWLSAQLPRDRWRRTG